MSSGAGRVDSTVNLPNPEREPGRFTEELSLALCEIVSNICQKTGAGPRIAMATLMSSAMAIAYQEECEAELIGLCEELTRVLREHQDTVGPTAGSA